MKQRLTTDDKNAEPPTACLLSGGAKAWFSAFAPASPSASADSEAHRSPPEKQLAARWASAVESAKINKKLK